MEPNPDELWNGWDPLRWLKLRNIMEELGSGSGLMCYRYINVDVSDWVELKIGVLGGFFFALMTIKIVTSFQTVFSALVTLFEK